MMTTTDQILLNDWHVVAKVEDCPPGKIVTARLLGEDLVLWRPLDPEAPIQVWQDYCPHRGVRLSLGEVCDRSLVCPYHGWQYDTTGKCVHIPAHPTLQPPERARVKTYHCQERYGWVWVCLGNPSRDVVPFPDWDAADCLKFWCGPYSCNASGFCLMDNHVDLGHIFLVHRESTGPSDPEMDDYKVEVATEGITIPDRRFRQIDREGKIMSDDPPGVLMKIPSPLTLYSFMEITKGPYKAWYAILTAITPVEEEKSLLQTCVATNLEGSLVPQWTVFHDGVILEDIRMVNTQRPARLPLLPRGETNKWPEEVHVPCDRASVAYRKWLKQLGVTYGVC